MKSTKSIRVLVVDDSFFMRKLISQILKEDSDIEVVGFAKDGVDAVGQAMVLKPDVITMDYNMPRLNGIEATREILSQAEKLPAIIMISAYTQKGANETFECLNAGAVDFIPKPSGELSLDLDKIKDDIIFKIKIASRATVVARPKKKSITTEKKKKEKSADLIVIGSSTGGPSVIEDIFSHISKDINIPIVIAQHMPAKFTKNFAQRLDKKFKISFKEASDGEKILPNTVYIGAGGYIFKIDDDKKIELEKPRKKMFELPSVDELLVSANKEYESIVAIILTGMGNDGLKGVEKIKKNGGYVIVQDPEIATIDSMPKSVIDGGYADEILDIKEIAQRIIDFSS